MIQEKIDLNDFLAGSNFSGNELIDYLYSHKIGITLLLLFKKAKQWPYVRTQLKNEGLESTPLLWAFLCSDSKKHINLYFDIHPMKCFPSLYQADNKNFAEHPIQILNFHGLSIGGCNRYDIHIGGKQYGPKQNEYCSAFGLPDDCFEKNFSQKYFELLRNFKDYNIWCFEESAFLRQSIPKDLKINYMKDEFLPRKCFFYVDTAAKFLTGLFPNKDLSKINELYWYSDGKDFIKERNYNESGEIFRFEKLSIENIKKRAIFEFIRQLLLLKNQEQFNEFSLRIISRYNEKEKIIAEKRIDTIIEDTQTRSQNNINSLFRSIEPYLDKKRLNNSHFLVMDVEFVNVTYPTNRIQKNIRTFKFPCIFTTVIWEGTLKTAIITSNVITLPCHYCTENCREFRKHSIKFRCLYFANSFISKQTDFFEKLLAEYESLKIFSYGKGDYKQLEHSDNFFIDSFNSRIYYRKNRKQPLRIIKIAKDISKPNTSLKDIEENIIKKWIIGWSRQGNHTNVNHNMTTHISNKDFSRKYHNAIETCISDSISTFLYLLYKDYRLNDSPIRIDKSFQTKLI